MASNFHMLGFRDLRYWFCEGQIHAYKVSPSDAHYGETPWGATSFRDVVSWRRGFELGKRGVFFRRNNRCVSGFLR